MKTDLAGGQLPFALFGANVGWGRCLSWAHNLNTAMKRLVLGKDRLTKRMKALPFRLICLAGRVVSHQCKLIIRMGAGAEALGLVVSARETIRTLDDQPHPIPGFGSADSHLIARQCLSPCQEIG
jgi:hypothetical protein